MKALFRLFKQWRAVRHNVSQVLSMNGRNLNFVYPNNHRRDFPIADNKLLTKSVVDRINVSVPQTYYTYGYFCELSTLKADLEKHSEFVIKPASGSGGGGIVVISDRKAGYWYSIGGTPYSLQDLRKHISDIIFGVYSFGLQDQAIIESRIIQHPELDVLSPYGLADVRLIFCRNTPVMAMIRLATKRSRGTANLHQGAVGVGVDMATGKTRHASFSRMAIDFHPDSGEQLVGRKIPYWDDIVKVGMQVARAVPLKYIGVDIAVSTTGPKLLEINARPGIEIQNANRLGMRGLLESIY